MKNYILIIFFWLLIRGLHAQKIFSPFSKMYAGFSTYSRHFSDVFSFSANQAALAGLKDIAGGVYSERPYLLDELAVYSGVLAIPLKNGGMGAIAGYSGDNYYRQWEAGLAYGKKLTKELDIGVQFNCNSISITGYGSVLSLSTEIGAILHLTDEVHAGVHITNLPVTGRNKSPAERPASVYSMGIGYEASEKLLVKLDVAKEEDQPARLVTGIQYNIKSQTFIRAAFITGGGLLIGTGLSWKNFRTDVTAFIHPQLGITPGFLLIITRSK